MAELTLQEKYDALVAHSQGLNDSVAKLQTDLDAALQREKDAAGARQTALEALVKSHDEEMAQLLAECNKRIDAARDDNAAVKAHCACVVQEFQVAHRDIRLILDESPASRALRRMHAVEAADLEKKHEMERAKAAATLG